MIEMKIMGVILDPISNTPIVILKDKKKEKRTLPIWVGIFEATAIISYMQGISIKRPLTHDLMKDIISSLKGEIEKVVIDEIRETTFFAKIYIKQGRKFLVIDARPSDAIALGLRVGVPIYADERVLNDSIKIEHLKEEDIKKIKDFLENLKAEDFGKYKM
jgi:bifunctional DNase/RNase